MVRPGNNRQVGTEERGVPRNRRRKEAILIKVEEGCEWLQVNKRIMAVRSSLEGATGVRRTRAGYILIEFDRTVVVSEAAAKLRTAMSDSMEVAALVNRATLQIRNIDPLTCKEELVDDIRSQWGIEENIDIEVKFIKAAPWSTQVAVVVLPASGVPSDERERRLKTGSTIASVRQLTNVQR